MQTLLKSSAQDEIAIAQTWKAVVDMALYCKKEKHGRGCVVYEVSSEVFGFITLFDLQRLGAKELEIDSDVHAGILREVGTYNFDSEVVLLIKSEHEDQVRYIMEISDLSYDGWRKIPEFANVRIRTQIDQKLAARVELARMKAARSPKKNKGKRKK
jgi:hypothetical protein